MNIPLYQLLDRLHTSGDIEAVMDDTGDGWRCHDLRLNNAATWEIVALFFEDRETNADIMVEAACGSEKELADTLRNDDFLEFGLSFLKRLVSVTLPKVEDSPEWEQLKRDITAAETQPRDACDLAKEAELSSMQLVGFELHASNKGN